MEISAQSRTFCKSDPAGLKELNAAQVDQRLTNLLAFASRVEHCIPLTAQMRDSEVLLDPQARQNKRSDRKPLRKVFDALATVCVSEEQHQVIAIGARLRRDSDTLNTTLVLASNEAVKGKTINYLRDIWCTLCELRAAYDKENRAARPTTSQITPPDLGNADLREETQGLHKKLFKVILSFTWQKSRRRILDKRRRFDGFPFHNYSEVRDLEVLKLHASDLLQLSLPTKEPVHFDSIKNRLSTIRSTWANISERVQLQERIKADGFEYRWRELDRYLRKALVIHSAATALTQLSRSSRCRDILQGSVAFHPLPPLGNVFHSAPPQTMPQWTIAINDFVGAYNDLHAGVRTEEGEEKEYDTSKYPDEYLQLETKPFSPVRTVHCEARLVAFFIRSMQENPGLHYYSYIGVSKLSCQACDRFIRAVNNVRGTSFSTQGCHHKWYYPWTFPAFPSQGADIARETYRQIVIRFVNDHPAFRRRAAQVVSDSAGVSTPEHSADEADLSDYKARIEAVRQDRARRELK